MGEMPTEYIRAQEARGKERLSLQLGSPDFGASGLPSASPSLYDFIPGGVPSVIAFDASANPVK